MECDLEHVVRHHIYLIILASLQMQCCVRAKEARFLNVVIGNQILNEYKMTLNAESFNRLVHLMPENYFWYW